MCRVLHYHMQRIQHCEGLPMSTFVRLIKPEPSRKDTTSGDARLKGLHVSTSHGYRRSGRYSLLLGVPSEAL